MFFKNKICKLGLAAVLIVVSLLLTGCNGIIGYDVELLDPVYHGTMDNVYSGMVSNTQKSPDLPYRWDIVNLVYANCEYMYAPSERRVLYVYSSVECGCIVKYNAYIVTTDGALFAYHECNSLDFSQLSVVNAYINNHEPVVERFLTQSEVNALYYWTQTADKHATSVSFGERVGHGEFWSESTDMVYMDGELRFVSNASLDTITYVASDEYIFIFSLMRPKLSEYENKRLTGD